MILYHYTSAECAMDILRTGFIMPSQSNAKPPDLKSMRIEVDCSGREKFTDANADYKPVVWFTSDELATGPTLGLQDGKLKYRFVVDLSAGVKTWKQFADENHIPAWWRKALERGKRHKLWYVYENGLFSIYDIGCGLQKLHRGKWRYMQDVPDGELWDG